MANYTIYTDGACSGNPGPGGYAAVILEGRGREYIRISGHSDFTTNNRMELKAIVRGLKQVLSIMVLKKGEVDIYTDSAYCLNPIELGWIDFWENNGWKTKLGEEVKNADLWQELYELLHLKKHVHITVKKVKGHSGDKFNELADRLAKEAIKKCKKEKRP